MLRKFLLKKLEKKVSKSLLVVNKKQGVTSFDEVFQVRKSLSQTLNKKIKVGHSGTLDPKVTGILVLGLGSGTKVLEYLLLSEKQYIAEFLFHKEVGEDFFRKNLKTFLGKINQLPPVKSAVKRQVREREVYDLKVLDFAENKRSARVFCAVQKGTYIRKLVSDLGEKMKINSSMGELDRVSVSIFSKKKSNHITTNEFEKKVLAIKNGNIFKALFHFITIQKYFYSIRYFLKREDKIKKISVNSASKKYILSGNPVRIKNLTNPKQLDKFLDFKEDDIIAIFSRNKVLAMGEKIKGLKNKELEVESEIIKLKKVF